MMMMVIAMVLVVSSRLLATAVFFTFVGPVLLSMSVTAISRLVAMAAVA